MSFEVGAGHGGSYPLWLKFAGQGHMSEFKVTGNARVEKHFLVVHARAR